MLRATFMGCALMLLVLLASATAEQLDFGFENLVANNVQIPLNFSDNYQLACDGISRSISPASQVFYPGAVLAFRSTSSHCPTFRLILRFAPFRRRYRTLGKLKFSDICVLREAWHSR